MHTKLSSTRCTRFLAALASSSLLMGNEALGGVVFAVHLAIELAIERTSLVGSGPPALLLMEPLRSRRWDSDAR